MSRIEIEFNGAVLNLNVKLEGKEVGLYFDGVSTWSRTLEHFPVEGNLDVTMLCKGFNGTAWSMILNVDDESKKYSGEIKNGYSRISDEIEIHQA